MVPNFISLLIDQMRGTSHKSQTAWVGCLDRRTNQSCPHRRTHQSCYNRHGEHINPSRHGEHIYLGLTGEHINPATVTMENTSIQDSQENTSILLQLPWRTHQSRPHRRTHQSCYNVTMGCTCIPSGDSELSCGHMLLQEVPHTPLELPELNVSYMTLIGGSLNNSKLFSESQKFYFPKGFCQNVGDLFICTDMLEPYSSLLHHISNIVVFDIDMLGVIMKYKIL